MSIIRLVEHRDLALITLLVPYILLLTRLDHILPNILIAVHDYTSSLLLLLAKYLSNARRLHLIESHFPIKCLYPLDHLSFFEN